MNSKSCYGKRMALGEGHTHLEKINPDPPPHNIHNKTNFKSIIGQNVKVKQYSFQKKT